MRERARAKEKERAVKKRERGYRGTEREGRRRRER